MTTSNLLTYFTQISVAKLEEDTLRDPPNKINHITNLVAPQIFSNEDFDWCCREG